MDPLQSRRAIHLFAALSIYFNLDCRNCHASNISEEGIIDCAINQSSHPSRIVERHACVRLY